MSKNKACFILTMVGVLIIIATSVVVSFIKDDENDKISYIENNLLKLSQMCVKEKKCDGEKDITIEILKLNNYIDSVFDKSLSDYSVKSYVSSDGKVYLERKE